jgi:hypothetical protein
MVDAGWASIPDKSNHALVADCIGSRIAGLPAAWPFATAPDATSRAVWAERPRPAWQLS